MLHANSDRILDFTEQADLEQLRPSTVKKRLPKTFADMLTGLGLQFRSDLFQATMRCPFCQAETESMFFDIQKGFYDCYICEQGGTWYDFLKRYHDFLFASTTNKQFQILSKIDDFPPEAFKRFRLAYAPLIDRWLLPTQNHNHQTRDLRIYNFETFSSLPRGELQMLGFSELLRSAKGTTIWITQGELSAIALRWLLDLDFRSQDVVVGMPNELFPCFKEEWKKHFLGKRIMVCTNNNDKGDAAALRIYNFVRGIALTLEFLHWPTVRDLNWAITDFVRDGIGRAITAGEAIGIIEGLMCSHPRNDPTGPKLLPDPDQIPTTLENNEEAQIQTQTLSQNQEEIDPDVPSSFQEILDVFGKWVKLDSDLVDAIAYSLAVCFANDVSGDPIWLQIVAPPGSGKTLILMALQTSERVVFKSTLTPASLVSGFNINPDPSLLPQLNGKCAVFKDGTELLTLHPEAKLQIYGILRGAFDGQVNKTFGNGVARNYNIHFNMLMGITPAVHGDNMASMGERFLRFEMRDDPNTTELKIRAAIENIAREVRMEQHLSDVVRRFLQQEVDLETLPEVPHVWLDAIVALAQITSMLRATVEREKFGFSDLKYRPHYESGTRLAKQLTKLGTMLCLVKSKQTMDHEIYQMVSRIAFDTCTSFNYDIVKFIFEQQTKQHALKQFEGSTKEEVAAGTMITPGMTQRRLADMKELGIVLLVKRITSVATKGLPPTVWRLRPDVFNLWSRATVQNNPESEQTV